MTKKNVYNDYIAGALGGCAGLVVGHPFDTTKVQLQTQSSAVYRGTWDAIRNISKHGMAQGFYRGLGFPLASYGIINSVFFGIYGNAIHKMTGSVRKPTYSEVFMGGALAGTAQLVIACPVDVVKVVLQSQIPATKQKGIGLQHAYFEGPTDCVAGVYRAQGVRGIYRGSLAMAMRDIPALSIYIVSYEWLNNQLLKRARNHTKPSRREVWTASLVSGGVAGVFSWILTMPIDTIKSKIQARAAHMDTDCRGGAQDTTWGCVRQTMSEGGVIRGMYRGTTVACTRAFPVNAVTFLVYSQMLYYLNNRHSDAILFDQRTVNA